MATNIVTLNKMRRQNIFPNREDAKALSDAFTINAHGIDLE